MKRKNLRQKLKYKKALKHVIFCRQAAVQHQAVENLHRLLQLSPNRSYRYWVHYPLFTVFVCSSLCLCIFVSYSAPPPLSFNHFFTASLVLVHVLMFFMDDNNNLMYRK